MQQPNGDEGDFSDEVEGSNGQHDQRADVDSDWDEQQEGRNSWNSWSNRGGDCLKSQGNDEERSIGERLEHMKYGAGPPRRKRSTTAAGVASSSRRAADREHSVTTNLEGKDSKSLTPASSHRLGQGDAKSRCAPIRGRVNKNRPKEVSSTRAVGRFREVVESKANSTRDPRFESGAGPSGFNYDVFRKAYDFLESYQDTEIEELKKTLRKEKNKDKAERLQKLVSRLQQQRAERAHGDRSRDALRGVKKKEREAVAAGKKPYFLKESEKRRLSLEQRYEELKEEGKLGRFMERKRKKNAAKEHRWLPTKRQNRG